MGTQAEAWIGQELSGGRYRITAHLGEGGMGFIYRAEDRQGPEEVVVKVPRQALLEEPDFSARFTREIRSLFRLRHPNIVRIIDVGEHDSVPFVVMQYLLGGDLRSRIATSADERSSRRHVQELARWLPAIAGALDFCHANHCVHRDVKPDNILFDADSTAFLSDFGIAKVLNTSTKTKHTVLTGAGMVLGTPQYMAPELILGNSYNGRADQYALAVTVYQFLSGEVPIDGPTPAAIFVHQTSQEITPLKQVVPSLSSELSDAVQVALAKDPSGRFPTCEAFAQAVLESVSLIASTGTLAGSAKSAPVEPWNDEGNENVRTHAFGCPRCGTKMHIAVSAKSQKITCSACNKSFTVNAKRKTLPASGRETPPPAHQKTPSHPIVSPPASTPNAASRAYLPSTAPSTGDQIPASNEASEQPPFDPIEQPTNSDTLNLFVAPPADLSPTGLTPTSTNHVFWLLAGFMVVFFLGAVTIAVLLTRRGSGENQFIQESLQFIPEPNPIAVNPPKDDSLTSPESPNSVPTIPQATNIDPIKKVDVPITQIRVPNEEELQEEIKQAEINRNRALAELDNVRGRNAEKKHRYEKDMEMFESARAKYVEELRKYENADKEYKSFHALDFVTKKVTTKEQITSWYRDIRQKYSGTLAAKEIERRMMGYVPKEYAVPSMPVRPQFLLKDPQVPMYEVEPIIPSVPTLEDLRERHLRIVKAEEERARLAAEADRKAKELAAEADRKAKELAAEADRKAKEEYDANGLVLLLKTVKERQGENSTEITGTIENRRQRTIGTVKVTFHLYDESNARIGTAHASITDLAGGDRWNFRAVTLTKGWASFRVAELSGS